MEINIEQRKNDLAKLGLFITSAKNQFSSVLSALNWTPEKLKDDYVRCKCPCNPNHLISQKTEKEHVEICSLKSNGYKVDEEFLSEPSQSTACSIKLDHSTKTEILQKYKASHYDFKGVWDGKDEDPMTSGRLTSTFSSDERLALYNYCVQNTQSPTVAEEVPLFSDNKTDNKKLSYEEQLALERDAKRRRIKYKAVHTKRKSHTEVIRDVITNQMELYEDWLNRQNKTKEDKTIDDCNISVVEETDRPSSSVSQHSNNSKHKANSSDYVKDKYRDDKYRKYSDRRRSSDRHHRRHRSRSRDRRHRSREKEYSSEKRHRRNGSDHYDDKYYRRH